MNNDKIVGNISINDPTKGHSSNNSMEGEFGVCKKNMCHMIRGHHVPSWMMTWVCQQKTGCTLSSVHLQGKFHIIPRSWSIVWNRSPRA